MYLLQTTGGIRDISYQSPLRAGKGSYYEGGIRVPLTIRWPNKVTPQTICTTPVSNLDFYPTFRAILGINSSAEELNGVDISPLLAGEDIDERPLFWHFPIYLQAYNPKEDGGRDPLFRTRPGSVVRKGKWKLHHYYEDNSLELYNLEEDLGETQNVASDFSEVSEELYQLLVDWLDTNRTEHSFSPNPAYDAKFEQQLKDEKLQ
ncbi:MAG: sulfatase/phosphatase domain-containing protein [Bacteroidota bacterium]